MRRIFSENLPLKIISLVVALVLYLFVMQEKEGERQFIVPVHVEENLDGYVLLTDIPDLRVVVAGRLRHLAHLENDQLQDVVVRLNETDAIVQFSPSDFDLPAGVEVKSIFPESVQLSYARLTSRELPIIVNTRGRPDPDYSVVDIRVTPDRVRVSGPEGTVDELTGVFTTPIDIYPTDTDDIIRPNVELVALGSFITVDRSTPISVTIDIEPNESTTQMTLPVEIQGPTDRFHIDQGANYARVWLIGPPTTILGPEPISGRIVVDTTTIADEPPGRYFLDPQVLNLPPGVRVERIDPVTVPIVASAPAQDEFIGIPIPMPVPFPVALPNFGLVTALEAPEPPE